MQVDLVADSPKQIVETCMRSLIAHHLYLVSAALDIGQRPQTPLLRPPFRFKAVTEN